MALGTKKEKVEPVVKETKSSKIVKLWEAGTPVGDIAKKLGIRYEFAYQVSKRYAQKVGKPFTTNRDDVETKADKIRELADKGLTVADIVKALPGTNYSYVWSTVDTHRKSKK